MMFLVKKARLAIPRYSWKQPRLPFDVRHGGKRTCNAVTFSKKHILDS